MPLSTKSLLISLTRLLRAEHMWNKLSYPMVAAFFTLDSSMLNPSSFDNPWIRSPTIGISLGKDSKKMKRKIVMKVPMNCRKCQTKALKIAAKVDGVRSVALGEEKDRVVVIGEGVDAIKLVKSLRKKFKAADIITVAEVK
ncbi:hypothetical protein ACFXTH_005342 [Malus domestica]